MSETTPTVDGTADGLMVKAEQVCKKFGNVEVLKGIDLQVRQGEVMCVVGPSGSGKSTFLRCINRLERPDSGTVIVGGMHIGRRQDDRAELGPREVARQRRRIGMVFQHFNLFPHLTVRENVAVAPRRVLKRSKEDAIATATKRLAEVGLESKADAYPLTLSGGQQQRVAIARALAMEPELMLFDEPTSALDPELVGEVLEVMRNLSRGGMTMIVVTHEIGFAREVADRIVFIAEGSVVEEGPPSRVLDSPQHERTQRFLAKLF